MQYLIVQNLKVIAKIYYKNAITNCPNAIFNCKMHYLIEWLQWLIVKMHYYIAQTQ